METLALAPQELAHLESADGAAAAPPAVFATTPTDNAYRYVATGVGAGAINTVQALIAGSKWTSVDEASGRTIVTYSFAEPGSIYNYGTAQNYASTLRPFSAADRALVRGVLGKVEDVANVQFVEVADSPGQSGVIRYGYSQQLAAMNYAGFAFYPSESSAGGDVWLDTAQALPVWDFYRSNLVLHETLHAVGLKHPSSGGVVLPADQDIIPNTVMSYSAVAGTTSGFLSSYPREPMMYDIATLQYLYGASASRQDDTRYDLAGPDFQAGFRTLWDAGGADTLDASQVVHGVTLDLRPGARSDIGGAVAAQSVRADGATVSSSYTSTLTLAQGSLIENAIGSRFGDRFVGNAVANVFDGGAGRDVVVYDSAEANYEITYDANGFMLRDKLGSTGADTLRNIERVRFSDGWVALDLQGDAGAAAKLLGAVFGPQAVDNPRFAGIVLALLDGGMPKAQVAQLALDARLGAHPASGAVADLLLANITGRAPPAAEYDAWTGMLDRGDVTAAELTLRAAETAGNAERIGLVGLMEHGLAYLL